MKSLSPLATLAPTEADMTTISPGMGAGTCKGSARSALSRALDLGATLRFRTSASRVMPFNS
jgi:hypothetical protein